MNNSRVRSAVSPLRRAFPAATTALPSVDELIAAERPEEPMHCMRPATVEATAREFVAAFPGDVLYAVKCNPEPAMLRAVRAGGVSHFDCASIGEVALVRQMFPDAAIHFMHPVKPRGAIREAWARHGVRDFVLDSTEELAKIRHEIGSDRRGWRARPDRAPGDAEGRGGAGPVRQVRRRAGVGRRVAARCTAVRGASRVELPCRFAVPGSARLADRAGPGWRGDPRCGGGDRGDRCRRRLPGGVSGCGTAAARRLFRRDRSGLRAPWPAGCAALGRAGPGAGGRRRIGDRSGAAPSRRCAVYQ